MHSSKVNKQLFFFSLLMGIVLTINHLSEPQLIQVNSVFNLHLKSYMQCLLFFAQLIQVNSVLLTNHSSYWRRSCMHAIEKRERKGEENEHLAGVACQIGQI